MNTRNRAAAMAMALAITCTAAPAAAQSLLDTFRSIKSDVERMGGKRKAPTAQPAEQGAAAPDRTTDDAQEGALMLSSLGDDASDTQLSSVAVNRRDPGTFDILGIKLGMSPREVSRIAAKYPIVRRFRNPTWRGTFDLEATSIANRSLTRSINARSPRTIGADNGVMRDGSGVEVQFTLEPAGPRLSRLMYQTRPNGQTREQLRTAFIAKYGKPDWDMGYQMFWCGGSPNCTGGALDRNDKLTIYMNESQVNFTLERSPAYFRRAEEVINARAQQIAGKAGKPITF